MLGNQTSVILSMLILVLDHFILAASSAEKMIKDATSQGINQKTGKIKEIADNIIASTDHCDG